MKVYVLTRAINQYDQDGEYFECVFGAKPSYEQLIKAGVSRENAEYMVEGNDGRIGYQDEWWYLTKVDVK